MSNSIKFVVLVIEDEENIASFICKTLKLNGYKTITASAGREALSIIHSQCPDLILLDLGLPDMDGMEIIRQVREWSSTPIIVVSARIQEQEKVDALDAGADDYITKPFDPAEVQARVRSQLRRYTRLGGQEKQPGVIAIGGIVLDDEAKVVTVDGDPAQLTPMEYHILRLLMQHPNKVYSSTQIYELVWQEAPLGAERAVAVHIRHLREKLEINPSEPRYITVVWGQGYKFASGGAL